MVLPCGGAAPRATATLPCAAMDDTALRDEAAELLRDLLRIDTSNPPGGETPAAQLLKRYLEANGVECELVARDPDRANLIARIPGSGGGPSLALVGHTDVVPADAEDWQRPPFAGELDRDGYIWGRGAVDMKNETATRAVAMAEWPAPASPRAATSSSSPRPTRRTARRRWAWSGWSRPGPTCAPTSPSTRAAASACSWQTAALSCRSTSARRQPCRCWSPPWARPATPPCRTPAPTRCLGWRR